MVAVTVNLALVGQRPGFKGVFSKRSPEGAFHVTATRRGRWADLSGLTLEINVRYSTRPFRAPRRGAT